MYKIFIIYNNTILYTFNKKGLYSNVVIKVICH